MVSLIIKVALYSALMYGIAYVVPGVSIDVVWPTAVIAGVVFALFNIILKPILKVLTLPITIITLGLFSIILNALLFWLVGYFVNGFDVVGWVAALVGGIIAAIAGGIINRIDSE